MVEYVEGYQEVPRDEYEHKTRNWEYKFCWLPEYCMETTKFLWLRKAYRGVKIHRYDWQLIPNHKWICKEEFIKLSLLEKL